MLWAAGPVNPLEPILAPVAASLETTFLHGGALALGIMVTVWSLKKCWLLFKDLLGDRHVNNMTWDIAGSQDVIDGTVGERYSSAEWVPAESGGSGSEWSDQSAAEQNSAASSYLDRYRA